MEWQVLLAVIVISYLLGSIPNGLFIGKWMRGIDIRKSGSHNIGATNAFRVLGPFPASIVLITDALKGVLAVLLGAYFVGTATGELLGGIAAIIGHNWSIYLKFKGGRGVATGLGVILVLVPKVTLIVVLTWVAIVYTTRYVSLASVIAAALLPLCMYLLQEKTEFFYVLSLAALFVIYRHKPNIQRLLKGEELKIMPGGKKEL